MTDARTPREQQIRKLVKGKLWHEYVPVECRKIVDDLLAALDAARQRQQELEQALTEALEGWNYAKEYKGDYFVKKHGDMEDIARLRAALARQDGPQETT